MTGDDRPVLFVTNHAPAHRVGAFARLHAAEDVAFALVGGRARHGGGGTGAAPLPFPHRHVSEHAVHALAASGAYRTVIAGISGRVALPAAYAGARRGRVPFVLWATLWAHPRTAVHALSYLPLRHIYRDADAIATYGPHVSAYVRGKGAIGPVVEAPQAVDETFWSAPADAPQRQDAYNVVFVGREAGEKGRAVLLSAWRASGLQAPTAVLVLVGGERFRAPLFATSTVLSVGPRSPAEVRNFYAASDVVVVPSIPTPDFLEPWGLVVNEAFHQGKPVIATTAVGAAAGGLVRDGRNGLVVAPGDPDALAAAILRLRDDPALRERLGAQAREDVRPYTRQAWADGMSTALNHVASSRSYRD